MTLRIIDNKRIDLTNSEFKMYKEICKAYSHERANGEDLFKNLFETNSEGMIEYLRPPTKEFTWEVINFLQNIMIHQHLRKVYSDHNEAIEEFKKEKKELLSRIEDLESKVNKGGDK